MVQQRLCLTCSKAFEVPATSKRKFCSVACRPRQSHPTNSRPDIAVECGWCGDQFMRKAWVAEQQERLGRVQYCSTACRDAAKKGRKGTRNVKWVTKECEGCGKPLELPPWEAKRRRFCSLGCAAGSGGRPGSRATRFRDGSGYVLVYIPPEERPPGHEKRSHQGEHRLVMSKMLGRWPDPWETVHHINGDKADNRPENLQLRNGRHGKGGVLRCRACGSNDIEHIEL